MRNKFIIVLFLVFFVTGTISSVYAANYLSVNDVIIISQEEELSIARELYAPFNALSLTQLHAINLHNTLTNEQLMAELGVSHYLFITYDRNYLEPLTNRELDMLMEPFFEVVRLLQARYGIGSTLRMSHLTVAENYNCPVFDYHNMLAIMREVTIQLLSGEKSFDEWFANLRLLVVPSIELMLHMAIQAMVIDGRLSYAEYRALYSTQLSLTVLFDFIIEQDFFESIVYDEMYVLIEYGNYISITPMQIRQGIRTNFVLPSITAVTGRYQVEACLNASVRNNPQAGPAYFIDLGRIHRRQLIRTPHSGQPWNFAWTNTVAYFWFMSADRTRNYVPITGRLTQVNNPAFSLPLPYSTIFFATSW